MDDGVVRSLDDGYVKVDHAGVMEIDDEEMSDTGLD